MNKRYVLKKIICIFVVKRECFSYGSHIAAYIGSSFVSVSGREYNGVFPGIHMPKIHHRNNKLIGIKIYNTLPCMLLGNLRIKYRNSKTNNNKKQLCKSNINS